MADVFISYKREDRRVAERLSIALEQLGFDVWWDFELLSGDRFRKVIEKVIDQCSATIVLWSNLSRESTFVVDEAAYAREQNKLCPARIDDCRLPLGFGGDHVVDLSAWDGEMGHEGLQAILRAVEAKSGKKARLGGRARDANDQKRFAELEAFKAAQIAENLSALRAFLRDYPDGAFAKFVRAQLEELEARAPKVTAPADAPNLALTPTPEPRRSAPQGELALDAASPPAPPRDEPHTPKSLPWAMIGIGGALAIALIALVVALRPWDSAEPPPAATTIEATRNVDAEIEAARAEERERAQAEFAERERQLREQGASEEAARRQTEQEQADRTAWGVAQRANSLAAYDAYLSAYPSGIHATDARSARQRLSAAASAPAAAPAAYDLAQLHPDVRRAVEQARDAERRANAAAARAREAAVSAQDAARRARAGEAGYGVETLRDGDRYEGGFSSGARNGYGVYVHAEPSNLGDRYEGQFSNGRFSGVGVAAYPRNPTTDASNVLGYEGEWAHSDRNGVGVFSWRNGSRYAGGNRDDAFSGPGVSYPANGNRYEGEWANSLPNGSGVWWDPQGRVLQAGIWANGQLTRALSR
ncbi:MAG: TIR domain-containing protein [Hyphomonadaceae bacterium]|nr:TIR domain-containing protein [Hyphomonadaceae bacterium]